MVSGSDNLVMPVAPAYGGNGGFGGFGGDWGWIILLLLFAGGGWGGGFGDGGIYPWMNQADITTSGFQNAATNQAISSLQNSVTSGFGDIQTALCGGFAGVNAGIANGFAQSEIAANSRQMASMNQNFSLQSALQECCCENRASIADVKYTIATEACANRATSTANTQAILDKLCQIEMDTLKTQLDSKNDRIIDLQNQINLATMAASQAAQTQQIISSLTPTA